MLTAGTLTSACSMHSISFFHCSHRAHSVSSPSLYIVTGLQGDLGTGKMPLGELTISFQSPSLLLPAAMACK